jgi:hypothetical protein
VHVTWGIVDFEHWNIPNQRLVYEDESDASRDAAARTAAGVGCLVVPVFFDRGRWYMVDQKETEE